MVEVVSLKKIFSCFYIYHTKNLKKIVYYSAYEDVLLVIGVVVKIYCLLLCV